MERHADKIITWALAVIMVLLAASMTAFLVSGAIISLKVAGVI